MNKTEKLIVALLLANIVLAGALHFLSPIERPAAHPETPAPASPVEVVTANPQDATRNEIVPAIEVPVDEPNPSDADMLREWARQYPRASIDWAVQQPDGLNREAVLEAACLEIANANPAEAVTLAEQYALTNHATLALLTQQWAQQDLRAARAWMMTRPAGRERNELAARVAYVWSATQPAAAAELVVQEIPQGPAQTEAAISVLHQWALRNFDDAAAWVELFPDGEIRDRAMNELAVVRDYSLAQAR